MENVIKILECINGLYITCPNCNESFTVKKARLFNIREPYSNKIKTVITNHKKKLQKELNNIEKGKKVYLDKIDKIKEKEKQLILRMKNRPKNTEIVTKSTNIGQILEKILPSSKNFTFDTRECVSVFKPIDYLAFKGLIKNNVNSISFIEVKTGDARLSPSQRRIMQIINDGNVSLKLF